MAWLEEFKRRFPTYESFPPIPRSNYLEQIAKFGPLKIRGATDLDKVDNLVTSLLTANKFNPVDVISSGMVGKKKLSKWLKEGHIPDDMISRAVAACPKDIAVEFTTSFEDILNMSDSTHYQSCLKSSYPMQIYYYLRNPGMGMFVVRSSNNSGFLFRAIARIGLIPGCMEQCLVVNDYKYYGSGPDWKELGAALEQYSIPVFGTGYNKNVVIDSANSIHLWEMHKTDVKSYDRDLNEDGYLIYNERPHEFKHTYMWKCRALNSLATAYIKNKKLMTPKTMQPISA